MKAKKWVIFTVLLQQLSDTSRPADIDKILGQLCRLNIPGYVIFVVKEIPSQSVCASHNRQACNAFPILAYTLIILRCLCIF